MGIGASAPLIALSTAGHSFYLVGWYQGCAIIYARAQPEACIEARMKTRMHSLRASHGKPFVNTIRIECLKAKFSFSGRLGRPNRSAKMQLQVGMLAHREGSEFTMSSATT